MLRKSGLVVGLAAIVVALTVLAGQREAAAADKTLTLNPSSGPVGTVVTGELSNAPPNDAITVIFKREGDPVIATGTTDANGHLIVTFTIPPVAGIDLDYLVYFTDFKCSCQIAAPFHVTSAGRTPTSTPTSPPTAAPTKTPTPPATAAATATPSPTATATSTPAVPFTGTGPGTGSGPGPNVGILALGMLAVISILSWFGATRRGPGRALALAPVDDEPDGYSTELDFESLDRLRRGTPQPLQTGGSGRGGRRGWAIGAGLAAIAGIVLLKKK
jgi:hypothetical protein